MSKTNSPEKEILNLYSGFLRDSLNTRSPHTVSGYQEAFSLFLDYLEETKSLSIHKFGVSSFTKDNVKGYMSWLSSRGNKPQTINLRLSQLRTFLKEVSKSKPQYYSYYDAISQIEKYKEEDRQEERKALSKKAIKALLATPGTSSSTGLRYTAMMSLQYSTATRIDEILSLKNKDLELDCTCPSMKVVGKGKKVRTVPIPKKTAAILKKYIAKFHGNKPDLDAYVFYSVSSGFFSKSTERGVNSQLNVYALKASKACREVPKHIHSHQLRHSGATHLFDEGMNIFQISKLLGHNSVETTKRYIGVTDKMLFNAFEKSESLAAQSIKPQWPKNNKLRDYFKAKKKK